jgi:hypothetical protein
MPAAWSYAQLELADRVSCAANPMEALAIEAPIVERPANAVRSVMRCFESDVEDKPWFYDRDMWQAYLSMLAAQRFNRFSLTLGLGYNLPRNLTDVYFYFPYPFLVAVPGYDVHAVPLPDAERDRNLDTVRFIGEETAKRGLEFRIGLWTHAYHWTTSPNANYTIEGLTPETHAAYCRDALTTLLNACPTISGVTFRIHGESGIPEGSYDFWQTLFDGAVRSGRRIEIDMHAKGMDQKTIDVALASGLPVTISPKFWAEHLGLGYHEAAIHEMEMPGPPPQGSLNPGSFSQTMSVSTGERRFLRYSYGDLLKEKRPYGVLYRVWPGTQRTLLWGDPQMAAAYGRESSFCGGMGAEIFEPLSFKGRMGSGLAGGRCAYADRALTPEYDWQKYLYQYRLWGRLLYNPDSDPEVWQRALRQSLGAPAPAAESALSSASRILPLLLTAHGASRSNNNYWPEMYTNLAIVDATRKNPYSDTPEPKRFGTVSPCDPQLFLGVDAFVAEMLASAPRSGKYSPLEIAQWMEDFALSAEKQLALAEASARAGVRTAASAQASLEFRRLSADVAIQCGLGHFFAWKFRSAVLWSIYDQTGDASALDAALKSYRSARAAWAALAERASGVYVSDVTYGPDPQVRGHWLDRLPAIDDDLADMETRAQQLQSGAAAPSPQLATQSASLAVTEVLARPRRVQLPCRHTPSANFHPGAPLDNRASRRQCRAAIAHRSPAISPRQSSRTLDRRAHAISIRPLRRHNSRRLHAIALSVAILFRAAQQIRRRQPLSRLVRAKPLESTLLCCPPVLASESARRWKSAHEQRTSRSLQRRRDRRHHHNHGARIKSAAGREHRRSVARASRFAHLRRQFRFHRHLLEQSSSHAARRAQRQRQNPLGQSSLTVLVVARAVRHRLGGSELSRGAACRALWRSVADVWCRLLYSRTRADRSRRRGLCPGPRPWQRRQRQSLAGNLRCRDSRSRS